MTRATPIAACVLSAVFITGCQALLRLPKHQCETDEKCVELLGPDYVCVEEGLCQLQGADAATKLPERWSCLEGSAAEQQDAGVLVDMPSVRFNLHDFSTHLVPADLSVSACGAADLRCEQPLQADVSADSEGYVTFQVPQRFRGRFVASAPGYMPSILYINRPVTQDYEGTGTALITEEVVGYLAALRGDEREPGTGVVVLLLHDCDDQPADGVTVALDEQDSQPFYFSGPYPDQDLTASALTSALTADGQLVAVGGFLNVQPGVVNLRIELPSGESVSSFGVEVRGDAMTTVLVYPGAF